MPLQQTARTPKTPLPDKPSATPYAFASQLVARQRPSTMTNASGYVTVAVVLCPFCAELHSHSSFGHTFVQGIEWSGCGIGAYCVMIPAGTPVMEER